MTKDATCMICQQPIITHCVELRRGIAHAGINVDGRFRSCSDLLAEYEHNWGRRSELETIVRSLRWSAGRLRNQGGVWTADDIDVRANKAMKTVGILEGHVALYYPWAMKEVGER